VLYEAYLKYIFGHRPFSFSLLRRAARSRRVVFVGGDEEKEGTIKIKNMETGEEKIVEAGKLLEFIT
jgi:hypothetical protein